ncbi:TetR/AcrR family transcriptional regulator [Actinomycetospora sp. NBRC 106378]|uniref:TetR/AcrR family transcriptional regulator n=1 Tax=Actinomycetospora sp. NBRC 106378 TaxID=3032208 RepID=UPI0024A35811|nr:TetR/AcrR family transcriptional regulator [Actinomycetospora sp. NBRC 106378]GLZ50694.1 TetR family transcriptional regulator [Actinomycetospora sp. NBRC 106378]
MGTGPRATVRDRLLATADRLFYAEGVHAVGIDRILAEAGVAKASLYAHFGGKDALVEAYLEGRSADWRAHVEAELPGRADDPVDRVLAVFDLLGEWFAAPGYRGCPFINVAAEYAVEGAVAAVLGRHRTWVRALFEGLLEEAGHAAPQAAARHLVMLYDGAMVAAHLDGDPTAARDAREAARTLLTRERVDAR